MAILTHLTAEHVGALVRKSKSQVNRDAAGTQPRLKTAQQFPGYNGARLFDLNDVADAYDIEPEVLIKRAQALGIELALAEERAS